MVIGIGTGVGCEHVICPDITINMKMISDTFNTNNILREHTISKTRSRYDRMHGALF